jgi:hypothetical protein
MIHRNYEKQQQTATNSTNSNKQQPDTLKGVPNDVRFIAYARRRCLHYRCFRLTDAAWIGCGNATNFSH